MTVVDLRSHRHTGTHERPAGKERRAETPLAALAREHDACCVGAVDPLEIAANLEASGMSDSSCRRLGYPDVFAVAAELFALVPRRAAGTITRLDRPAVSVRRCALRGLIYALPGLAGVGLGVQGVAPAVVMLAALTVGWAWSGAMAHLGHRLLGWEGRPAARLVLRKGLAWGSAVTLVTVLAATVLTGAGVGTLVVGLGLAWYMIAAGALLVLEWEVPLLLALLPAGVGAALAPIGVTGWVVGALPAVTVLATTGEALRATRRSVGDPPGRPVDVRPAVAHLVHGMISAGAVGLGPLTLAALRGTPLRVPWFVVLPLVLCMGPMELSLERLRRATDHLLWELDSPADFARRARRALLRAVAELCPVLAVVTLACWVVLRRSSGVPPDAAALLAAYVALAGCFFLGLVLVSTGHVTVVATAFGVALLTYLLLAAAWSATAVFGVVLATLFCALLAIALAYLRSPLVHL